MNRTNCRFWKKTLLPRKIVKMDNLMKIRQSSNENNCKKCVIQFSSRKRFNDQFHQIHFYDETFVPIQIYLNVALNVKLLHPGVQLVEMSLVWQHCAYKSTAARLVRIVNRWHRTVWKGIYQFDIEIKCTIISNYIVVIKSQRKILSIKTYIMMS